jgi:sodium-independent sulfate anion transporter 11
MSRGKVRDFLMTRVLGDDSEGRRKNTASMEQLARETIGQTYLEEDPSVAEWFRGLVPSSHGVAEYVKELFPSAQWIRRYNLHWLLGDVIAGITVGLVVVPQAMAYALLARLTPAFGLYTTFTGAVIYWVFGTSKDIVIGVSTDWNWNACLYFKMILMESRLQLSVHFSLAVSSARSKPRDPACTNQKR